MRCRPGVEALIRRGWRQLLRLALVLAGLQQLSGAALIKAKALLAPVLIERAWQQSLVGGGAAVKPWPWADTWPVAQLRIPQQGLDRFVLAGASGHALAFGPGHEPASAPLGGPGQAVIGGHRDTHFAFLRELPPGAALQLQLPDGRWRHYRAQRPRVVNAEREYLYPDRSGESLLLVTCYPFDALRAGGPLRFVVSAVPEAADGVGALSPRREVGGYAL